jgi:hypothetical protein
VIPKPLLATTTLIAALGTALVLYVTRGDACGTLRCEPHQVCELGLCVCPAGDAECTGKVLCNVDPLSTCPTSPENINVCAHCPDDSWICVARDSRNTCCYTADRKGVRACAQSCDNNETCAGAPL